MNDAETTREQKIADAEAHQQELHETGGTVEERVARLKELGEQITDEPASE
jgi:hypothetical protein